MNPCSKILFPQLSSSNSSFHAPFLDHLLDNELLNHNQSTLNHDVAGLTPYTQKAEEFFRKICGAIPRESFIREFLLMTFPE
jgi:hypothetical protein